MSHRLGTPALLEPHDNQCHGLFLTSPCSRSTITDCNTLIDESPQLVEYSNWVALIRRTGLIVVEAERQP